MVRLEYDGILFMNFFFRFIVLFVSVYFSICSNVLGCKYTVRDIGFINPGPTPYKIFLLKNNTPDKLVHSFERIGYASLL